MYRRPITAVTFELHAAVTDSRAAWGYHLENLLLRALATAAGVLFLSSMLSRRATLVASLVLVTHPLLATATSWLGCRPDLLATLGLAGCFWCLQEFLGGRRAGWLGAALGSFVFAALSKEQALVGAAVAVMLIASSALSASRQLALSSGWALLTVVLGFLLWPEAVVLVSTGWSPLEAAGVVLATFGLYMRVLFLPDGELLHTFVLPAPHAALVLLTLSSVVGWCALCWRARTQLTMRLGVLWVLVPLLPVLNISPMGSAFFAAYRATLSVGGLALCAGAAWEWAGERRGAVVVAGLLSALFVSISFIEVEQWATFELASVAALEATPQALYDRTILVERLAARGDARQALELLDEGLALFAGKSPVSPAELVTLSPAEVRRRALWVHKPSLAARFELELARLLIIKASLHDDLAEYGASEDAFRAGLSLQDNPGARARLEALEAARTAGQPPPPPGPRPPR